MTDEVVVVKRKSVSLSAGEMKLTILARRTRSGGETVVTTTDAKGKTQRGMTRKFETFELACASLDNLMRAAAAKGWKRSERAGGFKPRPDAFNTIPAAPKAEPVIHIRGSRQVDGEDLITERRVYQIPRSGLEPEVLDAIKRQDLDELQEFLSDLSDGRQNRSTQSRWRWHAMRVPPLGVRR